MDVHNWKMWHSWSALLGFPVMGIWPDYSDGTDINSLSTSKESGVVVTADDFGGVKLLNFPCLVEDAPFVRFGGHASHVSGVTFLSRDRRVVSVGSNDRAVFVWNFKSKRRGVAPKDNDDDIVLDDDLEGTGEVCVRPVDHAHTRRHAATNPSPPTHQCKHRAARAQE